MRHADDPAGADIDPHGALFGDDDGDTSIFDGPQYRPSPQSRSERHTRRRRRRRGRVLVVGVLVFVALVVVAGVLVVPRWFGTDDYSGAGTGSVKVTVHANDAASDIAAELAAKGVVASAAAFVDAADADSRSRGIQPGTYVLRSHMSGAAALALMLTPAAKLNDNVIVVPGATIRDVEARMSAQPCAASATTKVCGPGYDAAAVRAAFGDVAALGVPAGFTSGGAQPASVEGFLYPGTYFLPEDQSPTQAIQQMITLFAGELRETDFTTSAKTNGWSPYQQLVAASIAQSEAKNPDDMPKVIRVILNRIAKGMPLQSDATSAYGAKLKGLDASKVIYDQFDSPYNSYTHDGLPPTPISNPGTDALAAAAHPAAGDWLYFVNKDADGNLFFTDSDTEFAKAAATCSANHWGCG